MTDDDIILEIENSLEKKLNDSRFYNGEIFIQQDLIVVEYLKNKLNQHYDPNIGFNILGRYLNDGDSKLYDSWCRLLYCDKSSREWGQGYYRYNPNDLAECANPEFKAELKRRNRKRKLDQIEENK